MKKKIGILLLVFLFSGSFLLTTPLVGNGTILTKGFLSFAQKVKEKTKDLEHLSQGSFGIAGNLAIKASNVIGISISNGNYGGIGSLSSAVMDVNNIAMVLDSLGATGDKNNITALGLGTSISLSLTPTGATGSKTSLSLAVLKNALTLPTGLGSTGSLGTLIVGLNSPAVITPTGSTGSTGSIITIANAIDILTSVGSTSGVGGLISLGGDGTASRTIILSGLGGTGAGSITTISQVFQNIALTGIGSSGSGGTLGTYLTIPSVFALSGLGSGTGAGNTLTSLSNILVLGLINGSTGGAGNVASLGGNGSSSSTTTISGYGGIGSYTTLTTITDSTNIVLLNGLGGMGSIGNINLSSVSLLTGLGSTGDRNLGLTYASPAAIAIATQGATGSYTNLAATGGSVSAYYYPAGYTSTSFTIDDGGGDNGYATGSKIVLPAGTVTKLSFYGKASSGYTTLLSLKNATTGACLATCTDNSIASSAGWSECSISYTVSAGTYLVTSNPPATNPHIYYTGTGGANAFQTTEAAGTCVTAAPVTASWADAIGVRVYE